MARKDDLDSLIDELAADDPDVHLRVAAALQRRELARQLADCRRAAGLTQVAIAERLGTARVRSRVSSPAPTRGCRRSPVTQPPSASRSTGQSHRHDGPDDPRLERRRRDAALLLEPDGSSGSSDHLCRPQQPTGLPSNAEGVDHPYNRSSAAIANVAEPAFCDTQHARFGARVWGYRRLRSRQIHSRGSACVERGGKVVSEAFEDWPGRRARSGSGR